MARDGNSEFAEPTTSHGSDPRDPDFGWLLLCGWHVTVAQAATAASTHRRLADFRDGTQAALINVCDSDASNNALVAWVRMCQQGQGHTPKLISLAMCADSCHFAPPTNRPQPFAYVKGVSL